MRKTFFVLILLGVLVATISTAAAAENDNALAAVALYIDTSGHYVPGVDILNKALNEVIRYKVNLLMLGSEVQCGNEVLRDLNRCGITNSAGATPEALNSYVDARHVNHIILFSVRPLDVALDLKVYSAAAGGMLLDKSLNRPDGTAAMSTLDTLTSMVGDQITEVLQMIKG